MSPGNRARIHTRDGTIEIPPARARAVVDPTGCGDAYRAGLIYGLTHGMDLATTGRIASVMGALKIAHAGTQNQIFTLDELRGHFQEHYGYRF